MGGFDVVERGGDFDGQSDQVGSSGQKGCMMQIIIFPHQSSWLDYWNYLMNAFLMYGYFHDPYHIAMYICSGYIKSSSPEFGNPQ